jgi:hypothetical protein
MKSFVARGTLGVFLTFVTLFITVANASADQTAEGGVTFSVAPGSVFWAAFVIMTFLLLMLFLIVAMGLVRSTDWHLGDAASEEAGNQPSTLPVGTKPLMVASASRLIALLGLLVIMVIFLGFGYYLLYAAFASKLETTNVKPIVYFLFSGATMFAPYLANQLQSAFSAFAK